MKRRNLTPEEEQLWALVMRSATPLPSRQQPVAAPPPRRLQPPEPRPVFAPAPLASPSDAPLARGDYAGIDRNTAERFRKGKFSFDASLDLHGMTREKAHRELMAFVRSHAERGSRCLLIITGKGSAKAEGGVLRELLPHWLDEPMLKPLVLAFDYARPHHGGMGAYYVLLRRKRV
jgi:DNA-nicking Smr family endonuclease